MDSIAGRLRSERSQGRRSERPENGHTAYPDHKRAQQEEEIPPHAPWDTERARCDRSHINRATLERSSFTINLRSRADSTMTRSLKAVPAGETAAAEKLKAVHAQLNRFILGKEEQTRLCVACLLAQGHLLIEDLPGVGKTTLAHALAKTLGLAYQRIQFTSDLLPADIIGVSVYESESRQFNFHQGPIFAQLILADEVNRATPKTQSALLEAMGEHQVTAEGNTFALPEPFFVVATQNPSYQIGTFPLPESQLDRFLMRIRLGFPSNDAERRLLKVGDTRELVDKAESVMTSKELVVLQHRAAQLHVSDALLDYVQALIRYTRESNRFDYGLSPRAALAFLRAARAWAFMDGRDAVIPEDVQSVAIGILGHRLRYRESSDELQENIASEILQNVPIP